MNSMISIYRLAALALCGVAVAACDSIKDVRESPTYAIPKTKASLSGQITGVGVGTTRPMEVKIVVTGDQPYENDEDDESDDGTVIDGNSRTTYYSLRGVNALNFGSVDVGASYTITVTRQPFGRTCTPTNKASGTVTGPITDIQIECVRDSTPLYSVIASIDPALAAAPPQGFSVSLTTEEGVEVIQPAPGQTSITFDLPVFYPAANPPPFAYTVRATTTEGGTTNNCLVTNGSGSLGSGSGDITDVTVNSCGFTVAAVASYSAPPDAPPGPPPAVGANGITLGLKNRLGAIVAETAPITAFSPTPVAFPGTRLSNAGAVYEVTVTGQPEGQFCIVDNGGQAALVNPGNVTAQVRCRNLPAVGTELTGTYRVVRNPAPVTDDNPRPLATATDRHFMTFFANGTFLYGVHHSGTSVGVEHGFYDYNPGAQTLAFSVYTDSSGFPGTASCATDFQPTTVCSAGGAFGAFGLRPAANPNAGLSGVTFTDGGYTLPFSAIVGPLFVYGPPGTLVATNVFKTPGIPAEPPPVGQEGLPGKPAVGPQLSLTFGPSTWTLVAPVPDSAQTDVDNMDGTWVTEDSKRVWVYDRTTYFGWHAGVNGAPNLQDICYGTEKRLSPLNFDTLYSRRVSSNEAFGFGAVSCNPGGVGNVNVPHAASVPAIVPGFAGAMPGSDLDATVSPSPTYFRVTPGENGAPDTLTVQPTLNDNVRGDPIVFVRNAPN